MYWHTHTYIYICIKQWITSCILLHRLYRVILYQGANHYDASHIRFDTHTHTHTLEFLQWESYAADYNVFKLSVRSRARVVFARSIQWMQVSGTSLKCQIIFTFCTWWFVFNFVCLFCLYPIKPVVDFPNSEPLMPVLTVFAVSVELLCGCLLQSAHHPSRFCFPWLPPRCCSWLDATLWVNQLGWCVKSCVGLLQQDWIQVFFFKARLTFCFHLNWET